MTPRLDAISIVTDDLAASLAFYRRLAIDIPAGAETEPHVEATLPSGLRLLWDTAEAVKSMNPDWVTPPHGQSRTSLAFLCEDPAEVDTLYAELTQAGHHGEMAPWDAFWGQRYAVVHDPDGNSVDLFAPLPTTP
jgi:catechol 2,3-dioxygenase-like lactoylglutathione lyase family enzyme